MTQIRKTAIGIATGSLLLIIFTAFAIQSLPETIPIHWGITGAVDGWGPKAMLFFTAALPFLVPAITIAAMAIDPKAASLLANDSTIALILASIAIFCALVHLAIMAMAGGFFALGMPRFLLFSTGILFAILGNVMPRMKRNYTIGIRLPWALEDNRVWNITQRFGGKAFVVFGIGTGMLAFLPPVWGFPLAGTGLVATLTAIVFVSYRASKANKETPDA